MKTIIRNTALLVCAASLLCGCVKTIVPEAPAETREITYLPANYAPTKVTGVVYEHDKFGTYAKYHNELNASDKTVQDFMTNQAIKLQAGAWKGWNESASKHQPFYWPTYGSINFVSYSPFDAANPWISPDPSDPEGILVAKNITLTGAEDLLYSDMAVGYNSNVDEVEDGVHDYVGVPTLFRHALSRITIKAKTTKTGEGTAYESETVGSDIPGNPVKTELTGRMTEVTTPGMLGDINVNTVVKKQYYRTVTPYSQVTTAVSAPNGRNWMVRVHSVGLVDAVTKGDLTLNLKSYTPSVQGQIVGWDKPSSDDPIGWVPSETDAKSDFEIANFESDLSEGVLPSDGAKLMNATPISVIPQDLSELALNIKYDVVTRADQTITTTTKRWTVTVETTVTTTTVIDAIDPTLIYSRDIVEEETSRVSTYGTPSMQTETDTDTRTAGEDISEANTKSYDKSVLLYNQGGLKEWGMNKVVTYTVTIEPTGKRIVFDPAVVSSWGDTSNIGIE